MYKVVIIDDEFVIRDGMCTLVNWNEFNCEVVGTADDGLTGVDIIKKLQPDIIFVDIHMPNCNGLEMLTKIKDEIKDTEITILTGFAEFAYAQKAIELGVNRYLMKPSQMDEIIEALVSMTKHLDVKKGEVSLETENYLVNKVIKDIKNNYASKITLNDIADKCEVSVWHLSKLINQYCGKTYKELLNEVRISKAKKLLKETNLKMYEISEKVGISDITYFSKLFKKYVNMLPSEYKNNSHTGKE